jgi:hypothetical protein
MCEKLATQMKTAGICSNLTTQTLILRASASSSSLLPHLPLLFCVLCFSLLNAAQIWIINLHTAAVFFFPGCFNLIASSALFTG